MAADRAAADALRRAGDLGGAHAVADRLIAAGHDGWSLRAEILQDEGEFDAAFQAWDRAAARPDASAAVLTGRGNLLLDFGRIDKADAAFAAALALTPGHGPALHGRAAIAGFRGETVDVAVLEAALLVVRTDSDRVPLHFALGQAYLDQGRPDQAFGHFGRGNALLGAAQPYDVADDEQLMAAIAHAVPSPLPDAGGDPSDRPVFVIGMPRAGTSLLERLLSAHPDVHGAGELLAVKQLILAEPAAQNLLLGIEPAPGAAVLGALGRRYVEATAARAPAARRIIDKLPLNFFFAGLIHRILPNARLIHIRRDPLDTCLSCHTTLFREPMRFTHDQAALGRFHRAYQRLIADWRRVLPPDRFTEVEYADLVIDPAAALSRLWRFCGLGEPPAGSIAADRPIRTASRLQARRPVYRSSIGRAEPYRAYLAPLIAALAGEP